MPYSVVFSPNAARHLRDLPALRQRPVREAIRASLTDEPSKEDRNRFLMRPNALATWELRVDPQRVYYDVSEAEHIVTIVAIGRKRGSRTFIGGQEVNLNE